MTVSGCSILLLAFLGASLSLLALAGCGATPSVPPAAKKAEEKYPYPECAAFIKKIKDESGEPDRVEVVKWVGRLTGPGHVKIVAMVRDTNKLGAREVTERHETILTGHR